MLFRSLACTATNRDANLLQGLGLALLTHPGDLRSDELSSAMSSALCSFQQDPTPLIPYLLVMLGRPGAVAGKSPAALEELCREAPLDQRDTGQGSAPLGAGASRPLGSTHPSRSSEPKVLPKARSPPCRQLGASPRPLLRLQLPHGKTQPRVRNRRSFCGAMHGKGRKVFSSAGCA